MSAIPALVKRGAGARPRKRIANPDAVPGIDDAPSDIRSAREVGVTAAAAAWAPGTPIDRLQAESPDHLFPTVPAFRNWLLTDLPPEIGSK